MALKLPSSTLLTPRRPILSSSSSSTTTTTPQITTTQTRHATLIPRPARPYHFTQLVQLSDGSTYTVRTTSPSPLYRSSRDSRNNILWQPSDKSLRNVEVDEAGKLAAFRARYGRGWDAAVAEEGETVDVAPEAAANKGKGEEGGRTSVKVAKERKKLEDKVEAKKEESPGENVSSFDALADLISGYASKVEQPKIGKAQVVSKKAKK